MHVLLERQKEYVREDRGEYSCAMFVAFTSDGKSWISFPKYNDAEEKRQAYADLIARAKNTGAVLVITVNHARTRSVPNGASSECAVPEVFDETNSQPCILLTASGPNVAACSLTLKYEVVDGEVVFDPEPELLPSVEVNLLEDWPGSSSEALN